MRAAGIHHVALRVEDLERSAAFYRDVLGLPEIRQSRDESGTPRSLWLDLGGAILMLELELRGTGGGEGSGHLLALGVAELGPWERRLAEAGIAVTDRTAHTLYAADPDGHRVALSTYPLPAR